MPNHYIATGTKYKHHQAAILLYQQKWIYCYNMVINMKDTVPDIK